MNRELNNRIIINPAVMAGKPVIRGTRIPVDLIVRLVAQNVSVKEILEDYPQLKKEDIKAALEKVYIEKSKYIYTDLIL